MSQCPFANLVDPDTYSHGMPYAELQRINKEGGPVSYIQDPITGIPYWAITGQAEMDFISKSPKLFSSRERLAFPMEFSDDIVEAQRSTIINMDPPQHQKMRRLTRAAFTPKAVDAYLPVFKAHAKRIIDNVIDKGQCEFVEEVAAELPLVAILELLGVPLEDRKQFFDWTNTMIFADDPEMAISYVEGQVAAGVCINNALNLAAEHRINPMNNITGALLDGEIDGVPVSEEDFAWMFILLLVGGNESTRTVIAHGMRLLMEHPDQLQHLVDNPNKIAIAIDEILRYNTPFIQMRRTVVKDVELAGQQLLAGDKVMLHYPATNHDESVFGEDAIQFDIHRGERQPKLGHQLRSFGIGQHFCLGSHLARMELQVMCEEIIPRLRNPRFTTEVEYIRSYFVNGIKKMHIAFDSAG
jgi:cytochrome P450